jgi:hypothetical protein
MANPASPADGPAAGPGRTASGGQRFGRISGRRHPGGEPTTDPGAYRVRDDETGITYWFGYTDIVTEGLRTVRIGERVRFLVDKARPGHASYVIRLDLPDAAEYYQ